MKPPAVALATLALALPALSAAQLAPSSPPYSPAVTAGDFVHLSGTLPLDEAGKVVPGGIGAQTARVLDTLSALLAKNGSRMSQAAAVTVYLRNASDFAAMNEVYARYWPADPPTRTTVIGALVVPDALVEIGMVAVRDGAERRAVRPASWIKPPNPYSYAIRSGGTIFLSGLLSRRGQDNSGVPGGMTAQTETVLQNAREILAEAGMTLADVVSARVFITDTALFQEMNAAYRAGFATVPPARATVKTGLTAPQYLVEMTFVAVKGSRTAVTTPEADGTPGTPNPALSSAVQAGNRLYLSGMLGSTDATKGDAGAQTREAMARLGRTLKVAGFGWPDVVEAVVYLPDLKDFAAMNTAYREAFGPNALPTRSTVQAGLVAPDGMVEIMMTAVKK
jgi:2-iminobutanoate/2-iminopropanoate deaminase